MGCAEREIGLSLKVFLHRQVRKSKDLKFVIENHEVPTNEKNFLFSKVDRFSFGANGNSRQELCFCKISGLTQQPF